MRRKFVLALIFMGMIFLTGCEGETIGDEIPPQEIVASTDEINDFGRQVAAEFLGDFWSLFGFNLNRFDTETEEFFTKDIATWEWVECDGSQLLYWGGEYVQREGLSFVEYCGRIFNAYGEITDVPFIRNHDNPWFPNVANRFVLYDLNGSGIPDIFITFLPIYPIWEACLQGIIGETIMYRFVDGEYREMGGFPHSFFGIFMNDDGETIFHVSDDMDGIYGYYILHFIDGAIEVENIFTPDNDDMLDWWAHHGYEEFFANPNPTMFYTGMPLTRVPSLVDLWHEIRDGFWYAHNDEEER
ncbi:MAG: hypothetical protein FWB96_10695 [Defluviitaleaceae bacterium]|nr:hypothetical protein [Defluviitaleaceae bacterium]MCL2263356.1 hypothetical protein [Defluviitaleaceae bacterium]